MTASDNPISRPFAVDRLREGEETTVDIRSTDEERARLAARLGAPSVADFSAGFRLARRPSNRVRVEGEVRARVTQICVATLDPFETEIREAVAVDFAPEAEAAAAAARAAHEPASGETLADRPDPPDPIVDGLIDLGTLAVEFLALALDPYPRRPGATFQSPAADADPEESPFVALGRLNLDDK